MPRHQDVAEIDEQGCRRSQAGETARAQPAGLSERMKGRPGAVETGARRWIIETSSVDSPPSRIARAMKRVEWPEPTLDDPAPAVSPARATERRSIEAGEPVLLGNAAPGFSGPKLRTPSS